MRGVSCVCPKGGFLLPNSHFHVNSNLLSRMAPTYYFIVWFQASAATRLGSGPLWNTVQNAETKFCNEYWWANLLFINNYLGAEKMVRNLWKLVFSFYTRYKQIGRMWSYVVGPHVVHVFLSTRRPHKHHFLPVTRL